MVRFPAYPEDYMSIFIQSSFFAAGAALLWAVMSKVGSTITFVSPGLIGEPALPSSLFMVAWAVLLSRFVFLILRVSMGMDPADRVKKKWLPATVTTVMFLTVGFFVSHLLNIPR